MCRLCGIPEMYRKEQRESYSIHRYLNHNSLSQQLAKLGRATMSKVHTGVAAPQERPVMIANMILQPAQSTLAKLPKFAFRAIKAVQLNTSV